MWIISFLIFTATQKGGFSCHHYRWENRGGSTGSGSPGQEVAEVCSDPMCCPVACTVSATTCFLSSTRSPLQTYRCQREQLSQEGGYILRDLCFSQNSYHQLRSINSHFPLFSYLPVPLETTNLSSNPDSTLTSKKSSQSSSCFICKWAWHEQGQRW